MYAPNNNCTSTEMELHGTHMPMHIGKKLFPSTPLHFDQCPYFPCLAGNLGSLSCSYGGRQNIYSPVLMDTQGLFIEVQSPEKGTYSNCNSSIYVNIPHPNYSVI